VPFLRRVVPAPASIATLLPLLVQSEREECGRKGGAESLVESGQA